MRRIHDDGAMTAPSLSMHDEFVVAKIHPTPLLTRPDPRAPTDVMRRKGLDVGLCYDGNTNPRRRNHAVTRGPFSLRRSAAVPARRSYAVVPLPLPAAVRRKRGIAETEPLTALAPRLLASRLIQRRRSQEGQHEA